jgi:hypothetical protein
LSSSPVGGATEPSATKIKSWVLLWLPEEPETALFANVLETGFYQFTYFFPCLSHFADEKLPFLEKHLTSVKHY